MILSVECTGMHMDASMEVSDWARKKYAIANRDRRGHSCTALSYKLYPFKLILRGNPTFENFLYMSQVHGLP